MSTPKTKAAPKKKTKFCLEPECKLEAKNQGFCRLHYIANWSSMKLDKQAKAEKRLNSYVDRLARKYPEDYLERIKEGLENEEKFKETMQELEIEGESESSETDNEFLEKFLRDIKVDGSE